MAVQSLLRISDVIIVVFSIVFLSLTAASTEPPPLVTDQVWFDISIGGEPIGRITMGLFGQIVPKTVKNFVELAKSEVGKGYKGSTFHRVIKKFMAQGGDYSKGDGTGGNSIYASQDNPLGFFDDENFSLQHYGAGWLSMANQGENTNRGQFFILFNRAPHLNGKHVVFGKVTQGMDVLRKMEAEPVEKKSKRPDRAIRIENTGYEAVQDPFTVTFDDATA